MDRTLGEFPNAKMATDAVQQLVAKSFAVDDLELHAVRTDGSTSSVPIQHRSEAGRGFWLGGLLSLPIAVGLVVSLGLTVSPSLGVLAVGLGCTLGATLGVGWWSVGVDRSKMPTDAARYVVVVRGPAGRSALAQSVMQQAGGSNATPRAAATEASEPSPQ